MAMWNTWNFGTGDVAMFKLYMKNYITSPTKNIPPQPWELNTRRYFKLNKRQNFASSEMPPLFQICF